MADYATLAQLNYFGARSVRDALGRGGDKVSGGVATPTVSEVQWHTEEMRPVGLLARKSAPGVVFTNGDLVGRFLRRDIDDFVAGKTLIAESSVKHERAFIAPRGAAAATSIVAELVDGLAADSVLIIGAEDKRAHIVAAMDRGVWTRFEQEWRQAAATA